MIEFSFLVLSAFDVATASIEALLFSSFPIESLGSSVRRPLADVLFHVEVLSEDIPIIEKNRKYPNISGGNLIICLHNTENLSMYLERSVLTVAQQMRLLALGIFHLLRLAVDSSAEVVLSLLNLEPIYSNWGVYHFQYQAVIDWDRCTRIRY